MQTTTLVKPTPTVQRNKDMTINDMVAYLRGINEQRIIALGYYPKAVSNEKWDAVTIIRMELETIPKMLNPKQQVKAILGLENHFLMVQPFRTSKLQKTYLHKVEMAMDACRRCLGWQKQRA